MDDLSSPDIPGTPAFAHRIQVFQDPDAMAAGEIPFAFRLLIDGVPFPYHVQDVVPGALTPQTDIPTITIRIPCDRLEFVNALPGTRP